MEIKPIAYFRSPFSSKFGIPKQAGLVAELEGQIVFEPEFRNPDALRGMEGFDYLWLIWEFSANRHKAHSPVVRPPVLGGNEKVGVFATRSPFRPNNIGLSSVKISHIEWETPHGPVIMLRELILWTRHRYLTSSRMWCMPILILGQGAVLLMTANGRNLM